MKVLFVVHFTSLLPPACDVAHPAGSVPGATPSKFSDISSVGIGVPVDCVNGRITAPWALVTASENSTCAPGTNDWSNWTTNGDALLPVAPGARVPYDCVACTTVTPDVAVDSVAE